MKDSNGVPIKVGDFVKFDVGPYWNNQICATKISKFIRREGICFAELYMSPDRSPWSRELSEITKISDAEAMIYILEDFQE